MKPTVTGSDSMGRFMRLGSLVAIGVGVFSIGLAAVLLYGSMQGQLAAEQASRSADDRARTISTALEAIQSTLGDPQVLGFARDVLASGATEGDDLGQAIRSRGVANILDLRAFPATIEEIELGEYPEPDFTVIEMLIEARRDGRATIQAHYPGTANENLAFAQAVRDQGSVVGVLFLRTPISAVTSLLRDPGSMDYVALVQGRGNSPSVLKSLGVAPSAELRRTPIPASQLALVWSRSTLVGPLDGRGAMTVGVVGLVLLIAGLLIRRQAQVARVISGDQGRRAETVERAPQARHKEPVAERAAAREPGPGVVGSGRGRAEDLPDWLLDGDADDQDRPAGLAESRRSDLPDLPDTLSDDVAPATRSGPSTSSPAASDTAESTLFLDDEADEFFEPRSGGSEHRSGSGSRAAPGPGAAPGGVPRSGAESGEREYRLEPESPARRSSESIEADEPPSLGDGLDDGLDDALIDEDIFFVDSDDAPSDAGDRAGTEARREPEGQPDPVPQSAQGPKPKPKPESEPESEANEPVPKPARKPPESKRAANGSEPRPETKKPTSKQAAPKPRPEPETESAEAAKPPVLDPALFASGQISGIVEDTLDARSATMIGQAIGSEARSRGIDRLVVARDGRLYGAVLLSALSQGIRAAGVQVIDAGAVPTPTLHFAADELTQGSGVMVTGSHFPPEWNGFRIRLGGRPLLAADIENLFRRVQDDDLVSGQGEIEEHDISDRYIERIAIDIQLERPLKVVVDCANGITGTLAPKLLEAIGADVIPLYADVDGNFPNHHPDPSDPDNLEDLKLCVRNFQADVGLAFDGDGDRMALISDAGEIVWPDRLMMLLASDILQRQQGTTVVIDSESSSHLQAAIEQAGGRCHRVACDEAVVAEAMIEHDAPLGGLFSGNLFVAERWFTFDDALYAAARLLELLAADTRPASALFAELPAVEATAQIRLPVESEKVREIIEALIDEGDFEDAELSHVDGLRVTCPDAWGMVRVARSAPELVLRFEGNDAKAMNRVKTLFKKQLKRVAPDLKLLF